MTEAETIRGISKILKQGGLTLYSEGGAVLIAELLTAEGYITKK